MIERIILTQCATYPDEGVEVEGLKQVNFFYGANGAGKTTISRAIAGPGPFTGKSTVEWANGRELKTLVYNRDFLAKNLESRDTLPGVFTLGSDNVENVKRIVALQEQEDKARDKIDKLKLKLDHPKSETHLGGLLQQLDAIEERHAAQFWKARTRFGEVFKDAFIGRMKSKKDFMAKVLSEAKSNAAPLASEEILRSRAETVFGDRPVPRTPFSIPDEGRLIDLEAHELLAKPIIGKRDTPISAMIDALGNANWVEEKVCRSLLSWVNAGSHHVLDGLHAPMSNASVDMFRKVFKRVFEQMNHLDHYELMKKQVLGVG